MSGPSPATTSCAAIASTPNAGTACTPLNRRARAVPVVTALTGAKSAGPIVAASDYMKSLPGRAFALARQASQFRSVPDGFGRSDNREHLRRHFEVDAALHRRRGAFEARARRRHQAQGRGESLRRAGHSDRKQPAPRTHSWPRSHPRCTKTRCSPTRKLQRTLRAHAAHARSFRVETPALRLASKRMLDGVADAGGTPATLSVSLLGPCQPPQPLLTSARPVPAKCKVRRRSRRCPLHQRLAAAAGVAQGSASLSQRLTPRGVRCLHRCGLRRAPEPGLGRKPSPTPRKPSVCRSS